MGEKRASRGESTIRWSESEGRFHGYVSDGSRLDGKRRRQHFVSFRVPAGLSKTKFEAEKKRALAEVKKKIAKAEELRDAGIHVDGRGPTLGEYLRTYLDTTAKRRVRDLTWIRYDGLARNQIIPTLGKIPLEKLEPEHVEAAYTLWESGVPNPDFKEGDPEATRWVQKPLSGSSVLQVHRVLSKALKVAVQRRKVSRNVCNLVDAPTNRDRKKAPAFTAEELPRYLAAVERLPLRSRARFILAVALGLRQSEILGLTWDRVDLDTGTVKIEEGLQRVPGKGLMLNDVKSRTSHRTLALAPPLVRLLKAHRKDQLEEQLAIANLWRNARNLVFVQGDGAPVEPRADLRAWNKLLADAGLEARGTHAARRTAASVMARKGIHPAEAKEVLGHSQVSLTIDLYTDVDPSQNRAALEAVSSAMFPDSLLADVDETGEL